ncbi:hypothetical protein WA158_000575 [Blastocystis sp. Blastoise]
MSEEINSVLGEQEKNVVFIFQDETRDIIPLSFLKRFPQSVLSLTYNNSDSYIEDENAYYIDFPSFSMRKIVSYMNKSVSLDSMSFNEVISIYKNIKCIVGDQHNDYEKKICDFLMNQLIEFVEQNNCHIFGDLDNRDISHSLSIHISFYDDIAYEDIYPSNLHSIFPQINDYSIIFESLCKWKRVNIQGDDPHYDLIRQTIKQNHHFRCGGCYSWTRGRPHIIRVTYTPSHNSYSYINSNSHIYDENKTERKESRSSFVVQALVNCDVHSLEGYDQQIQSNMNSFFKRQTFTFYFNYNNGKYESSIYHIDMPPLLRAINNNIFDAIQHINFFNFIQITSYPEHKELFKQIITSHVFPNVTTFNVKENDFRYIYWDIFPLISRENFPRLHIYTICSNEDSSDNIILTSIPLLFHSSLLQLIDTLNLSFNYKASNNPLYLLSNEVLSMLVTQTSNQKLTINTSLIIDRYDSLWKQLYDSKKLNIDTLCFDFEKMNQHKINGELLDFSSSPFECLYIYIDFSTHNEILNMNNVFKNMNYTNLKTVTIDFVCNKDCQTSTVNDYFSILCSGNYNSVTELYINEREEDEQLILQDKTKIENTMNLYKFLSLFTNKVIIVNLSLAKCFSNINVLERYEIVPIKYINDFILCFKHNPSIVLPFFNQFQIDVPCKSNNSQKAVNIFQSFPSLSVYLHKPVISIKMPHCIFSENKHVRSYCDYIFAMLGNEKMKSVQFLELFIIDKKHMNIFLNLLNERHFPCLKDVVFNSYYRTNELYKSIIEKYMNENNHYFNSKFVDLFN